MVIFSWLLKSRIVDDDNGSPCDYRPYDDVSCRWASSIHGWFRRLSNPDGRNNMTPSSCARCDYEIPWIVPHEGGKKKSVGLLSHRALTSLLMTLTDTNPGVLRFLMNENRTWESVTKLHRTSKGWPLWEIFKEEARKEATGRRSEPSSIWTTYEWIFMNSRGRKQQSKKTANTKLATMIYYVQQFRTNKRNRAVACFDIMVV